MNRSIAFDVPPGRAAHTGVAVTARDHRIPWGFPEFFVISQTALPALLYLPGTQGMRLFIRFAAFAVSLGAFVWWQAQSGVRPPAHRAYSWVAAIMGLLALMLFNPYTTSLTGGLAHMMVYFAVLSPLFWAPAMVRTPEQLARLLALLLVCSGINSLVGVLQVYDPARFMPAEISRVLGDVGLGAVTFRGPDGQVLMRPPGLFDTPGAVAGPGMYAALLGAIFGLSAIPVWQRIGAFALSATGFAAIYLSQVRISLVVAVVMFLIYAAVLMAQKRIAKAATFALFAMSVVVISFGVAITLGGDTITSRVMTLFSGDPLEVYYRARGAQLHHTFSELLYAYPLGAGLGRWGMAGAYFGNPADAGLWAEIQIAGWVIDGGVLMLFLYGGAIAVAAVSQFRLARTPQYPRVAACAAVVLAANLGTTAMVFSFTPFVTQIGIQYWFLAGALHGVARNYRLQDA
jgi:hypothetical protein